MEKSIIPPEQAGRTICMVTQESCNGVFTVIRNVVKFWPNPKDHIIILCNRTHGRYGDFWTINRPRTSVVGLSFLTNQDICTFIKNGAISPRFNEDGNVSSVMAHGIKNRGLSFFLLSLVHFLRPFMLLWHIYRLKRFFEKHKVTCVFSHNGGWPGGDLNRMASIAAGLAGIEKNYMVIHDAHMVRPLSWLVNIERSYLLRYVKKFITVSHYPHVAPKLSRLLDRPVEVIENGIDPYEYENRPYYMKTCIDTGRDDDESYANELLRQMV